MIKFNKKIIILLFIIISYKKYNLSYLKNDKICICTIGKRENLYAREYVKYYKEKGVNKIFIYDNNDINDEKFDIVLNDFIEKGFVEIIDIRGKQSPQLTVLEDCRKNNFKLYKWLIFFDMDEYLYLRNFNSIPEFLNQKIFDKCQSIQLNWYFHTDNNLLYYDNRTLRERFPEKDKHWQNKKLGGSEGIKCILKGKINIKINDVHLLNSNLISCNGFGDFRELKGINTDNADHYYNYIDHYYSKSTEEFVNKLLKGSVALGNNTDAYIYRIGIYFYINEITLDKINYIENRTKLNLDKYRLLLKNNLNSK